MKRVFLYDMDRVLLLFLLLANLEEDEITYVTYEGKEDKLRGLKGDKIVLEKKEMYSKYGFLNRFKMSGYIKRLRRVYAPLLEEIEKGSAKLYGMDNLELGRRVFYREKINVIEEGVLNYMPYKRQKSGWKGFVQKAIALLYGLHERKDTMGYGRDVEKVYLTTNLCSTIPQGLEKKACVVDIKKLWERKSQIEKESIKRVFAFNEEILKKVDGDTVMLFTQPISEDGIVSEEEKIDLYSKIVERYSGQSLIIKGHPREKTDYSKYFPQCYVMKERYPIELLTVMGVKITRAVTLFSTAVFGLGKDVEIDFYGSEVNDKLFRRFGSCDNIMKRNKFL